MPFTPHFRARIRPISRKWSALAASSALVLGACASADSDPVEEQACLQVSDAGAVYNPGAPGEGGAPEIPTGFASKKNVTARNFMVVAANPLAAKAGCDVLRNGGSAVDAAIATQMVLNIVEPQSSGIGGGAFMLHYNAAQKTVVAYDGRETAPAAATENYLRWVSDTNRTPPLPNARSSGRSIGTPGVMRMLELAHKDAGVLPWKELFNPAITIATDGFKVSPRMSSSITSVEASLQRDAEARAYFLDANGKAWAAGTLLKSPALATTFTTLANQGAGAFYGGAIAQDIVDEIADTTGNITPGVTTLADLAAYQAKKREAVCINYRSKVVCGMPPPSSGGLAVAQALGILETYNLSAFPPSNVDDNGGKPSVTGVHLVSEALRLAYADRDKYVADADFVALPGGSPAAMLDKTYLRQRASMISLSRSMGTAQPGTFPGAAGGVHPPARDNGTTHLSVVDRQGNVVSMTTTIESGFGAFHMTKGGFLLNNQLTDFSATPTDAQGVAIANRLQPGKRPRSSMAPTLVFDANTDGSKGDLVMATGSPGGSTIIQYTTKTLVGVLDWGLNAQQATSMINFGAANSATTNVGGEHPNVDLANGSAADPLVSGLRGLGHTVSTAALSSGVSTIVRRKDASGNVVFDGGADPRREGVVLGNVVR
ncbi:MAG: gamma-glutamyltransferase [Ideonella sp.]|nr:gamma-glutamyltransferase [Ideonella sp.]